MENDEYLLKDKVEVGEVIKQVVLELEERAFAKKLEVRLNLEHTVYFFKGNRELMFNLFYNLINNAIKYTADGFVEIRTETKEDNYWVYIEDTGAGIESESLPFIFQRFGKPNSGKDSFGLGLALAKKIADYHKIQIEVSSQLGKGTKFTLIFQKEQFI